MSQGHSHSHSHDVDPEVFPRRPLLERGLIAVVLLILIAGLTSMALLWPGKSEVPRAANPYSGKGVSLVKATVKEISTFDCGGGEEGPDSVPTAKGKCANVTATTSGGAATFQVDSTLFAGLDMKPGDKIKLIRVAPGDQAPAYTFYDYTRGLPLALLAVLFALLVILVGRWRGGLALVGVAISLLVMTKFMFPAMLAGSSPLAIAVTGSTVIMIVVLYLAHGISIRTTAALFGTLFGVLVTASLGLATTDWAHLTGVGSENDRLLVATAPTMNLAAVVGASMVIAGLGVLNDVTITQASSVWELKSLQPQATRVQLFTAAMRIGRDHIASSVYTLVFAYAGSALTVFLLISAYGQRLVTMATTEEIGQEVARTLVGGIGLVLAVPATTAIAVALTPTATTGRRVRSTR